MKRASTPKASCSAATTSCPPLHSFPPAGSRFSVGLFALGPHSVQTFVMSSVIVPSPNPIGLLRSPSATVKLGGSLLDLTDLASRLDQIRPDWGDRPLLVVGGGSAADLVRGWDQQHQLGEARSHWLALDSLDLTSRLLAQLWPVARIASITELEACWQQGQVPVIRAREWFEFAERASIPAPPQNWDTTTDTIAAWVAAASCSASLWLLKSVEPPTSLDEAAQRALVDANFIAWMPHNVPCQWVNLRESTSGAEVTIQASSKSLTTTPCTSVSR